MKKTAIILSVCLFIFSSCKKKKDETPAPTPIPDPLQVPSGISVKVNGVEKHCLSCYSTYNNNGLKASYFYLDGFKEYVYIYFGSISGPGTYILGKSNVALVYNKSSWNYHGATGTFNVTKFDTSSKGTITTLIASFDFKTDTSSSGDHFDLTGGTINVQP